MPTIIVCPSCNRKLRVPDDLRGARVRCPTCGALFDAADSPPAAPQPPASTEDSSPVGFPIKLSLDDGDPSPPAEPEPPAPALPRSKDDLRSCPYCGEEIGKRAVRCPFCDEELAADGDDRPWERRGVRRDWEPHRGSLALVLGIMSIVCGAMFMCYALPWVAGLPLGIIAWVIGKRDLKKMRENLMDPEGQGTTQAGYVCGIIGTILNSLMALLCLGGAAFIGVMMYMERNQRPPPLVPPPPPTTPQRKLELPLRLQDYLPMRR